MTSRDDDIVFQASVDDLTLEFFRKFDNNLDKIEDHLKKMGTTGEESFGKVGRGSKTAGAAVGAVAGIVASLSTKLLDMAMAAGKAFTGYIKEATALRARVDTLAVTIDLVGRKAGYSASQIEDAEENLKALGITTAAARNSLIQMTRANIDWAEATKLARLAQDSAVVAGLNSSEAFERLIRGIQKQEPELLDELGIQLRRSEAYDRLAASIGKSSKELTRAEQTTAILNEIYRQSEVVTGAYEASLGSVGKQVTSLPRYFEELKLAVGGAFQEAHGVQIAFMTEKLKAMHTWVVENEDALNEFGSQMARSLELVLNIIDKVAQAGAKIPGIIESMGIGLAKILSSASDAEVEAQAAANVTAERFKQLVSLIVGFFTAGFELIKQEVGLVIDTLNLIPAFFKGDYDQALSNLQGRADNLGNAVRDAMTRGTTAAGEFFGLIKEDAPPAAAAVEEFTQAMQELQEGSEGVDESLLKVDQAMRNLRKQMEREMEDRAIRELRRQAEEAIRLSHQLQDIERNYQKNIARTREKFAQDQRKMVEDGQEQLIDLHEERARRAIEIEEDYRRRIQQIAERYETEAGELARERDAIGILRLMRRHQLELEEERKNADQRRRDNEQNFHEQFERVQEQLREQQEDLREAFEQQMASIEEQRKEELENLERSLERQRELRELHNQWEEEDRQLKYERELEDLAEQFVGMEGLTEEGLAAVLGIWEEYFGDLSQIQEEYVALQQELAAQQVRIAERMGLGGIRTGPLGGGIGNRPSYPGQGTPGDPNMGIGGPPQIVNRPYGQAGQISHQLAGYGLSSSLLQPQVPRLPLASMTRNHDKREISITAAGLEPLIQRQLVAVLTEIERNNL